MELVIAICKAFVAASELAQISDWLADKVRNWSFTVPSATIDAQVEKIAKVTEADVRKVVAAAFAKHPRPDISEAKREELISAVVNLSRNVRYRSSVGTFSGSSFRSIHLLEVLLKDVEPVRHQLEPVAPGSPWVLKKHLGMGSFGEVWMAINPGYPTARAYKFFKDSSGEWLKREQSNLIALLNRLGRHNHIVDFLDIQTNCPYPYLALEFMEGGSLEEWIVKDESQRPRLETHEIIRQVVSGLAAAHSKGIAHRDMKPANILLTLDKENEVQMKISDFGLGKVLAGVTDRPEYPRPGSLDGQVGTPLYLPPEAHRRGRRKPEQDDVFALGVIWYQLAMGDLDRPPYDFAERLRSKNLDSHTIGLIERCLAHPDRRFKSAVEIEAAIGDSLPTIKPAVPGIPDVQFLAIEYLSSRA